MHQQESFDFFLHSPGVLVDDQQQRQAILVGLASGLSTQTSRGPETAGGREVKRQQEAAAAVRKKNKIALAREFA